jgi:hypothetical protein
VKNGNRIVFCHIDFIKDTESSIQGTQINRPLPQCYGIVFKRVGPNNVALSVITLKKH